MARSRCRFVPLLVLLILSACAASSCAPGDPRREAIEYRAQYEVTLLGWAEREDGSLALGLRVTGPVDSRLDRLTVEAIRYRADESVISKEWFELDVSSMQRGTPLNTSTILSAGEESPEALGIDMHAAPSAEAIPNIPELQIEQAG